jgi:hypothetical protein
MTKRKVGRPFEKRHQKAGGRKAGVPNKITRVIKEAVIQAGVEFGYDGKGKEELVGLFKRAIRENIGAYLTLIGKILPTQVNAALDVKITTESELRAEYERLGIPYRPLLDAPVPTLEITATQVPTPNARKY